VASYAVGDIQGCFKTLMRLLAAISFDPASDRLWVVGDLVNRGPRSLEVLRWARDLGERHHVVLGNHDLHLLSRAAGLTRARPRDTLDEILAARDRDELIDWLAERPFLVREGAVALAHAGIHPAWTAAEAEALAGELRRALAADREGFLAACEEKPPRSWDPTLSGKQRLSFLCAALTRMRMVHGSGRLVLDYKGPPDEGPPGTFPWFRAPGRRSTDTTVVFGHWASLGLDLGPSWVACDTGCVWGQRLTAVRLDDRTVFSEPFAD
jgi:bis(5'-nucleosyl)-tetraphosphatase (symmetrical)